MIILAAVLWAVFVPLRIWWARRGKAAKTDEQFLESLTDPQARQVALRIRQLLRKHLGSAADLVSLDDDLWDVGVLGNDFDLSFTAFVMDVEKDFGRQVPDGQVRQLGTLRQWTDYLCSPM